MLGGARITFHEPEDLLRAPRRTPDQREPVHQPGRAVAPAAARRRLRGLHVRRLGGPHGQRPALAALRRDRSTLCVARFPQLTLAVGDDASDPRVSGNHIRQCGPGKLTLEPGPRTVDYGERLQLRGLFLGRLPGRASSRRRGQPGTRKVVRLDSTHTKRNGRFRLVLRPGIGELVRLRSGSLHGPVDPGRRPAAGGAAPQGLEPRRESARGPLLRRTRRRPPGSAPRPLGQRAERRAAKAFTRPVAPDVHGVLVRVAVPRAPGYLPAHSDALKLP